jgi:hypothetical protein
LETTKFSLKNVEADLARLKGEADTRQLQFKQQLADVTAAKDQEIQRLQYQMAETVC